MANASKDPMDSWAMPKGWELAAHPDIRPEPPHVDLVRLDGTASPEAPQGLEVPAVFVLTVHRKSATKPWAVKLTYAVVDGVPVITTASCDDVDLVAALDDLRATRPLAWWTRAAVSDVLLWSMAERVIADLRPKLDLPAEGTAVNDDELRRVIREVLAGDTLRSTILPQIKASLGYQPPLRKNRVTDSHLQDVARIYLEAEAAGEPPREAVKRDLKTSGSTASRWISLARDGGYLGPAKRGARTDLKQTAPATTKGGTK